MNEELTKAINILAEKLNQNTQQSTTSEVKKAPNDLLKEGYELIKDASSIDEELTRNRRHTREINGVYTEFVSVKAPRNASYPFTLVSGIGGNAHRYVWETPQSIVRVRASDYHWVNRIVDEGVNDTFSEKINIIGTSTIT